MEGSNEGAAEKPVHLNFTVLHLSRWGILLFLQVYNFQLMFANKLPGSCIFLKYDISFKTQKGKRNLQSMLTFKRLSDQFDAFLIFCSCGYCCICKLIELWCS